MQPAVSAALNYALDYTTLTRAHGDLDAWMRANAARLGVFRAANTSREMGDAVLMTAMDSLRSAPRAWLSTRLIESHVLAREAVYRPFEYEAIADEASVRAVCAELEAIHDVLEAYLPPFEPFAEAIERRLPPLGAGRVLHRVALGADEGDADDLFGLARAGAARRTLRSVATAAAGGGHAVRVILPVRLHLRDADGRRAEVVDASIDLLEMRFRPFARPGETEGDVVDLALHPYEGMRVSTLSLAAWCAHHARRGKLHRAGSLFAFALLFDPASTWTHEERLRALDDFRSGASAPRHTALSKSLLRTVYASLLSLPERDESRVHFEEGVAIEGELGGRADGRANGRAWARRSHEDGRLRAGARRAATHDLFAAVGVACDAMIASHMMRLAPLHAVTYVSSEGLADTFF